MARVHGPSYVLGQGTSPERLPSDSNRSFRGTIPSKQRHVKHNVSSDYRRLRGVSWDDSTGMYGSPGFLPFGSISGEGRGIDDSLNARRRGVNGSEDSIPGLLVALRKVYQYRFC